MATHVLEIKADDPSVREYYESVTHKHEGDSGIDLYVPADVEFRAQNQVIFVSHKIQCRMMTTDGTPVSYWLVPRSSIAKTPLMLANSIGLIDAGYRGDIIAALRYVPNTYLDYESFTLGRGSRIMQICAPNLGKIIVRLVESLDETTRGAGGFGSTDVDD